MRIYIPNYICYNIFVQVRYYLIGTIIFDSNGGHMKDYSNSIENCPIASIQKIIHGKWTMVIIYFLSQGTLRFSELKRKMPNVTDANITKELRLLEEYGIVHREVYREVPPKVEYSLTPIGNKFLPVLESLEQWACEYNSTK